MGGRPGARTCECVRACVCKCVCRGGDCACVRALVRVCMGRVKSACIFCI